MIEATILFGKGTVSVGGGTIYIKGQERTGLVFEELSNPAQIGTHLTKEATTSPSIKILMDIPNVESIDVIRNVLTLLEQSILSKNAAFQQVTPPPTKSKAKEKTKAKRKSK